VRQVSGDPDINNLPPFSGNSTVGDVKTEIEKVTQVPVMAQRLIYKGKILQDGETMEFHQVKDGETFVFQVVKKLLAQAKAQKTAESTPPTSPQSAVPAAASSPVQPTPSSSVSTTSTIPSPAVSSPAAAASSTSPPPAASTTPTVPLEMKRALDFLSTSNNQEITRTALTTLSKVIENIVTHPQETKYQKIKKSNAVFNRKLGGVIGGEACILASGFVDDGEGSFVLTASAEAWDHINACRDAVSSRLSSLAPVVPSPTPVASSIPTQPSANPSFGMPPTPMTGDMSADMMSIASNPQALQQVLNPFPSFNCF